MKPVPSVSRSAGSTSSWSAATCSITSRASRAAMITALPTRCVPRLANVPMQCGPVSVSAVSTMMFSNGSPSVSAAHCAAIVLIPWPRSTEESVTTKLPVVVEWMSACDGSPPRFMPVG